MQDVLRNAMELHQAGQFGRAALLYQQVLRKEEENAEALHLLGVLHHQQGEHARAVEEIGRAISLQPSVPVFHANLAEVYRAMGDLERAAGSAHAALSLAPNYPEALNNLGLALQGLGRHAEAAEQFRRALELEPDFAPVHNNLGISLRDLKQFDDALTHFNRAVEVQPGFAAARTNLGLLLLDRGKAEEALPHCREAARLQPNLASMHHNLATALRGAKNLREATSAYLEAVRLDPNLAVAHGHLGMLLQEEGKLGEALPWLKRAVELDADNAGYWEALAELCAEREEYPAAIHCWETVIRLDGKRVRAYRELGAALQEEGRLEEAAAQYDAAQRLDPDVAATYLSQGGLHEIRGNLAEAEAAFRTALRLHPAFPAAHARLATLLRGKLPDADRAALETRLADDNLAKGPRARLLFARAHVLDGHGDYAGAAACLREANALSLELAAEDRAYVPAEHERFVRRLLDNFAQEFFARTAGGGLPTRRPVFVFGLPRSGTTLIEQIIASHAGVHGAGELRFGRQSFESIPAAMGRPGPPIACVADLDPATLRRLAEHHDQRLLALGGDKERVVDKMPDNYLHLGLLAAMFPQATFIHCRRDLRDIAVSCWMTDFRSIRWANDPEHIAHRFQQYRRLMEHWRNVLPVPVHEVDYEETVSDLETVARRLVTACGLDWNPACLEFHRTQRPIRTASVTQVRQPVYQRSVARWRNYEGELADVLARVHVEMKSIR